MAAPKIKISINTADIDKSLLYSGKKGKYLNVALFDRPDDYSNDGFVTQDVSKEQREAGVKGPIIGNWKYLQKPAQQPPARTAAPKPARPQVDSALDPEEQDVPF